VHTSKAYEIRAHTFFLILMEELVILGKINGLGTREMNLLSVDKVNTLSLLYVPSHTYFYI